MSEEKRRGFRVVKEGEAGGTKQKNEMDPAIRAVLAEIATALNAGDLRAVAVAALDGDWAPRLFIAVTHGPECLLLVGATRILEENLLGSFVENCEIDNSTPTIPPEKEPE